jgi:MFS family permease
LHRRGEEVSTRREILLLLRSTDNKLSVPPRATHYHSTTAYREEAALRATNVRYAVLAGLSAIAAIAYLQRQLISVVAAPLGADLQLSEPQLGSVMASFYLGYALFQIPSGWLADRWGTRKSLSAFAALWSLAAAAMSFAGSYASVTLLWFVVGSAQAGAFPCAASSIRKWLPLTRRAFASGILASFMSLGGALSAYLAGKLIGPLDWRWLFVIFSLPGFVWAGTFFWAFRDSPAEHKGVNLAERKLIETGLVDAPQALDPAAPPVPWLTLLSSRSMWAICGQQFFRAAAYIFFATWFPTYLKESRGLSIQAASELTSLPLLAVVAGSPLGGTFSDWLLARTGSRWLSRCVLSATSMWLCAALIAGAYFVEDAHAAVLVISAGSFCAAVGGVSAYTITMDLGGRHVATVFSVMNMCGNIGAAIFPPFVGWLVHATGRWDEILLVFAALYVATAVCWMLLNPARAIFPAAD